MHLGTSFVGRGRDLQELTQLFEDGVRLVTVLGPAGVGKSRLASAFAAKQVSAVCDLTQASTTFEVVATIGRTLDASLASSSTVDEALASLAARVRGQDLLIVLDNFEQAIAEAAPILSQLLGDDRGVRLLVTSRERLRLPQESVLDLAPLSVEEARTLFLDRARAVRHGYQPNAEESGAIDAICRELDGLPLAIELAAARVRVMTAVELRARLSERFSVLSSSERTHSPRHATLRTALDWSWASLSENEKSGLAQCAAFEGGFTLEAAEAVLETNGPVLDILHALRDKSLVWAKESELGLRFGLYLSIGDYAAEKLTELGLGAVFERHADYYLARAFYWAAHSEGAEGSIARRHLEAEQPNLLAIHRRAGKEQNAERSIRAAIALQPVLIAQGPAALRLALLDRALELGAKDPDIHPRLIGWATLARGDTLFGMGRMAECRAMFDRAISEGASSVDDRLHGRGMWLLGAFHAAQDRFAEAADTFRRALVIHKKVGDRMHEGRALSSLGALALEEGDLDGASEQFEEALALLEEIKDERWIGRTIEMLGSVEDARGNVEEARQLYLQAISVHERNGDRRHLAHVLGAMAALDLELGNLDRAEETFERALAIRREVPDRRTEGMVRVLYATLLEQRKDSTAALKMYREAVQIYREIESPRALAIALAHRARAEAQAGKRDRAQAKLAEARSVLGERDPQLDALLGIVEGHLALAEDPRIAESMIAAVQAMGQRSAMIRRAARALRAALSDGLPDEALVVGMGWFKPPNGRRIDISSRRAPSALMSALALARKQRPGASLTVDELFDAGWAGERALPAAAASRVYVAISTLRKLGLKELLIRDDAGYRLDPSVPLLEG